MMRFLEKEMSLHNRQSWDIIFWAGILMSFPLLGLTWILAKFLLWAPTLLLVVSINCMYKNNMIALRQKKEEEKE